MFNEDSSVSINNEKFNIIFEYYNIYFSCINMFEINELLPKYQTKNNISVPDHQNILDFFIWISSEINKIYKVEDLKKTGQFHTEDLEIIDIILDETINFESNLLLEKKVLEPSCGTGIFILKLIDRLFEKGISKNELIKYIENNITAFDISSEMVYFTKLNIKSLLLYLYKDIDTVKNLKLNVFLTDATYKPNKIKQLDLFAESTLEFIESEAAAKIKLDSSSGKSQFDYIIGNPPYVTFYGRRDAKKSEELRDYYIQNYRFVPNYIKNGKFNLTMFFFEQSIDWLKENGRLSFIIDITFFETAFKYLRKFILENSRINHLIINLSTFKNVGSGQLIIVLEKNTNVIENNKNMVKVTDFETENIIKVPQRTWNDGKNFYFSIIDPKAQNILNKIERKSNKLVYYFPGKSLRTSTMMLSMEDKFTHKKKIETSNDIMPYYIGSKSLKEKFGKLTHAKYFEYNRELQNKINEELKIKLEKKGIKNKKRIGLGDLNVFNSPKIFIRQSAKQIISSLSIEPAAANNSLYCLSESQKSIESINKLKITNAQLNSTISTFYALTKRIIRVSNGKQPQINVSDLKKIRLTFDKNLTGKLLEIANKIMVEDIESSEGIELIDSLLFTYYELTEDEIEFVYNHIKTF